MKELSRQQKKIVQFIRDYTRDMEIAPTVYEIANHLMIRPSTAFAHVNALQKKNILCRTSKARSIKLLEDINVDKKNFQIPLLSHPADIDFNRKTSQYLYYDMKKKYAKFKDDICSLKADFDLKNPYRIMRDDILTLIRHPDPLILENGMVLLAWEPRRQYHFTHYYENMRANSCKIVAAVIELQRSI